MRSQILFLVVDHWLVLSYRLQGGYKTFIEPIAFDTRSDK